MNIKTTYTYESGSHTVTVILEGAQAVDHLEKLRSLLGVPDVPTDKEMEDMEEYFEKEGQVE